MADNGFWDYLNENPESAYFANQNQWKTPNQKKYFQSQFSNIQNEYLGQLGQQIMGGGAPTLNFTDFLSQMPWTQKYAQLPPSMRGSNQSQYSPVTRWNV